MTRPSGVVAGIDEAGLGPILGPLTMGWTAFAVQDSRCLWEQLGDLVSRVPGQDRSHLVVADSKLVFTRNPRGEKRLERTVLSFLQQLDDAPGSGRELILRTPGSMRPADEQFERHPWYGELPGELPIFETGGRIEASSESLRAELRTRSVQLLSAGVSVNPAGELNDSYRRTNNKSRTLWEKTAPLLIHLWNHFARQGVHVTIDRQGGRLHYSALLLATFPKAEFECLREGRDGSEYRLSSRRSDGSEWEMRVLFVEKADRVSFPVALASCLAKYSRELCMRAFNRYFEALQPGLKPTAGYTTDGRRWIEEANPAIRQAAVDSAVLIRER